MAAYFFDTSAIVKRYVQETGTAWVRRLVRMRSDKPDLIFLARITVRVVTIIGRLRITIIDPGPSISKLDRKVVGPGSIIVITRTGAGFQP